MSPDYACWLANLALPLARHDPQCEMTSAPAKFHERIFDSYEFEFTQPMTIYGMRLEPVHAHSQVEELVSDRRRLHLTGYGILTTDAVNERTAWQKSGLIVDAMTFAQQRQVETTVLIARGANDTISDQMGPW